MKTLSLINLLVAFCTICTGQIEIESEYYEPFEGHQTNLCSSEEVLDSSVNELWMGFSQMYVPSRVIHYYPNTVGLNGRRTWLFLPERDTFQYQILNYDVNRNQIKEERYRLDNNGVFYLHTLLEMIWDSEGNLIEDMTTIYGAVPPYDISSRSKTVLDYNATGDLLNYIEYDWALDIEAWTPSSQYFIEYNGNGERKQIDRFIWDTLTMSFIIPFSKSEYTYVNGLRTEWKKYVYDLINGDYELDLVAQYDYDANGNQIYYQISNTNENGELIPNAKTEREFTICDNISTATLYAYSTSMEDWSLYSRTIYYYSEAVGIADLEIKETKAFPNPTRGIINLDLENNSSGQLQIFNGQGNQISSKLHPSNEEIDLSSLTSGIYFLRFDDGKEVYQSRVLKVD